MQKEKQTTNSIPTRHGAQGQLDGASKSALENEFGTSNEDEVIKQIITKGSIQSGEVRTTAHSGSSQLLTVPLGFRAWR